METVCYIAEIPGNGPAVPAPLKYGLDIAVAGGAPLRVKKAFRSPDYMQRIWMTGLIFLGLMTIETDQLGMDRDMISCGIDEPGGLNGGRGEKKPGKYH